MVVVYSQVGAYHGLLNQFADVDGLYRMGMSCGLTCVLGATYQPSMPEMCSEKKTSAILVSLTSSSFF